MGKLFRKLICGSEKIETYGQFRESIHPEDVYYLNC